jgi:hypothetical protein
VSDSDTKARKKEAKSRAKMAKARARETEARSDAASGTDDSAGARDRMGLRAAGGMPEGVGVSIRRVEGYSELVVSGLRDEQLRRIIPGITKEVTIAMAEERSAFVAGAMRFVREGLFQTVVKIVAGLVVGYLLIRFGLG